MDHQQSPDSRAKTAPSSRPTNGLSKLLFGAGVLGLCLAGYQSLQVYRLNQELAAIKRAQANEENRRREMEQDNIAALETLADVLNHVRQLQQSKGAGGQNAASSSNPSANPAGTTVPTSTQQLLQQAQERLRKLREESEKRAGKTPAMGMIKILMGDELLANRQTDEAIGSYQSAINLADEMNGQDSLWKVIKHQALDRLGDSYLSVNKTREAHEHYKEAMRLGAEESAQHPDERHWRERDFATLIGQIGLSQRLGRLSEAKELITSARQEIEQLVFPRPGVIEQPVRLLDTVLRKRTYLSGILERKLIRDKLSSDLAATDSAMTLVKQWIDFERDIVNELNRIAGGSLRIDSAVRDLLLDLLKSRPSDNRLWDSLEQMQSLVTQRDEPSFGAQLVKTFPKSERAYRMHMNERRLQFQSAGSGLDVRMLRQQLQECESLAETMLKQAGSDPQIQRLYVQTLNDLAEVYASMSLVSKANELSARGELTQQKFNVPAPYNRPNLGVINPYHLYRAELACLVGDVDRARSLIQRPAQKPTNIKELRPEDQGLAYAQIDRLANVLAETGQYAASNAELVRSLTHYDALSTMNSEQFRRAEAKLAFGLNLLRLGDAAQARKYVDEAFEADRLYRSIHPPSDLRTLNRREVMRLIKLSCMPKIVLRIEEILRQPNSAFTMSDMEASIAFELAFDLGKLRSSKEAVTRIGEAWAKLAQRDQTQYVECAKCFLWLAQQEQEPERTRLLNLAFAMVRQHRIDPKEYFGVARHLGQLHEHMVFVPLRARADVQQYLRELEDPAVAAKLLLVDNYDERK